LDSNMDFLVALKAKRLWEETQKIEIRPDEIIAVATEEEVKGALKEAKPDPMKPKEEGGMIMVPVVDPSSLEKPKLMTYQYDSERGIQVVIADKGGKASVYAFIFEVDKRWTKEFARREIENIVLQKILHNQDCLGQENDFLFTLKAKRIEEQTKKLELKEDALPQEAIEAALEEGKEPDPDPMEPFEDDEFVFVRMVHPDEVEETGMPFVWDANMGIEAIVSRKKGGGMALSFFCFRKGLRHRWTKEYAKRTVKEINVDRVMANLDLLEYLNENKMFETDGKEHDFVGALVGKETKIELAKLEVKEEEKEPEIDPVAVAETLAKVQIHWLCETKKTGWSCRKPNRAR